MRISQYLHLDKRLKSLRIGADISQKKMAQMLNLSVPTYSNYENGYSCKW
ncbi:MAG: helix-turn-helix transcriptional regulator [Lachnospiraceae bacterium]|nr:helix-turn-helix transcriptional regulator [Lachnospiraceae bacterium]